MTNGAGSLPPRVFSFAGYAVSKSTLGGPGPVFGVKLIRKGRFAGGIVIAEHPRLGPCGQRVDGHPLLKRQAGLVLRVEPMLTEAKLANGPPPGSCN